MDYKLKYLCIYIIFLWTLSLSQCQKDDSLDNKSFNPYTDTSPDTDSIQNSKWVGFTTLGQRTLPSAADDKLKSVLSNSLQLNKRTWPFIISGGKRRWMGLNSWGKRLWLNPGGKRRWRTLGSWGKRSDMNLDMNGKSDEYENVDLPIWRKLSGLPISEDDNGVNPLDTVVGDLNKRKWLTMAAWGKRDNDDEDDGSDISSDDIDKRRWASFRSWGKRDMSDENVIDKRKWLPLSSWGKRARWSALSSWGKRRWNALSSWGKRGGRWKSFASWGKRSNSDTQDDVEFNGSNNPHSET